MKATPQPKTTTSNEVFTYIAIPVEALQQSFDQGGQSLTVAQNILLKALPDGNISQQIQPITEPESYIFKTSKNQKKNLNQVLSGVNVNTLPSKHGSREQVANLQTSVRPTVIEHNSSRGSIRRKTVILQSGTTQSENCSNKSEVRYLNNKYVQPGDKGSAKGRKLQTGTFKCTVCGELLGKMITYRKHLEMHRNAKKFKCEHCSAGYNVEENLKLHSAMHTKTTPTCPICNRKFQRLASLKAHLIIHEVEEVSSCLECLAEFDEEDDLYKHMETHKYERVGMRDATLPLKCSICSHVFDDLNQYKEHISFHVKMKRLVMNGRKHKRRVNCNREQLFKCEICKKSFSKFCLLERHMRIHSGEKPFSCHICERSFNQKGTLQIHLARHSGIKPFQCTLCPSKFNQKGNLRVHVQKTHIAPDPDAKIYKCTMCTCIFKKVSSLNAHITRVHAGDKPCDDINDLLQQLQKLEKHLEPAAVAHIDSPRLTPLEQQNVEVSPFKYVKLVDSSTEGPMRRYLVKQKKIGDSLWYACSFCGKEFKKPSDLIRHIRVHTREKPFKCKQCDQAFSLKSTLTSHMTTHLGKRQYQCILCLKTFTTIRTLNSHIRKHETRPQQYPCDTCNMVFPTAAKAKMHTELHEKGDPVNTKFAGFEVVMQQPMMETESGILQIPAPKTQSSSNEPDLSKTNKCHFCSAAFVKAVHLKRHMLIHNGDRKYKCNICPKKFYTSYALKDHVKFHGDERNFSCKICSKRFVTNAILKRHLAIHSSNRPYFCPYCKKRFKTVMLCRKHIKIHRRDLNLQIHAMNETGELESIVDSNVSPIADLNDSLPDLSSTLPDAACNLGLSLDTLGSSTEVTKDVALDEESFLPSHKQKLDGSKGLQLSKDNVISKILYTDENGIIISADLENPSQDLDELQNAFNQHLFQTSILPANYDRGANLALLSEPPNDLSNVNDAINTLTEENLPDDSTYSTILINSDDLQTLTTASLYNACLAQLKNNDPLLNNCGINEMPDPSVLFPTDPTLNQITDSQLEAQPFEMLMPAFTFSTNLGLNNLAFSAGSLSASFPNIILSNAEDGGDVNSSPVLPSINEIAKKPGEVNLNSFNAVVAASTGKSLEQDSGRNLEVGSSNVDNGDVAMGGLNQESAILSMIYNASRLQTTSFSTTSNSPPVNPNSSQNHVQEVNFACSTCDTILKDVDDVKNHCCPAKQDVKKIKKKESPQGRPKKKLAKDDSKSKPPQEASSIPSEARSSRKFSMKLRPFVKPKHYEDTIVETTKKSNKNGQFKCNQCNKVLKKKNALARHLLTHQEKKVPATYNCTYCEKVFKKPSDLERHLRIHTGEKPFSCDNCEKSFSLKSTLDTHSRTHKPGGNKDFSCAVCSSNFSSKSSLRIHTLVHTGVKPYQCALCPERFRTSGNRKSHMGHHMRLEENKTKTTKVNNLFTSVVMAPTTGQVDQGTASLLNENMQQPGMDNEKDPPQLLIQEGDKNMLYSSQTIQVDPLFLQQLQLNNILLQDGAEELSYVQLNINSDGQITDASEINNFNETLYQTEITGNFPRRNPVPTKSFQCDACPKMYCTKAALVKHKKRHNPLVLKCTKCDAKFSGEEDLANHVKLHSGYRPFCCQLCANTFSLEKHLKAHMKRIHDIAVQS